MVVATCQTVEAYHKTKKHNALQTEAFPCADGLFVLFDVVWNAHSVLLVSFDLILSKIKTIVLFELANQSRNQTKYHE